MYNISNCPFCDSKRLYHLKDEYNKCSFCNKKFSLKKLHKDNTIIEFFCNNINANKCSKILNLNYRTVQNRYVLFRRLIANYSEKNYHSSIQDNSSYEEFYYFTNRQKSNKRKSLYDAINIIGFYSNKNIFTLLMPKLPTYNSKKDTKSFESYLKWHKIYSQNSYTTPLNVFWKYLEENLKKYKGINEENFFFYLKECEFKFNHLQNRQIEILKELYFQ
jgi:transposase-like protein